MLAVLHLGYAMGQPLDQGIYVNYKQFSETFFDVRCIAPVFFACGAVEALEGSRWYRNFELLFVSVRLIARPEILPLGRLAVSPRSLLISHLRDSEILLRPHTG